MISSPFYGIFEVKPQDWDDNTTTAIDMDAVVGAKKTLTVTFPQAPLYFGYRPIELFDYHTFTTQGVLVLYKYPLGVFANRVLLGSINLEDGAANPEQYMIKIANTPTTGTSGGHAYPPVADCSPGDQLVAYILTQAVGDTYICGTFQPVLYIQYRGENFASMPMWHDVTVAGTGISNLM